MSKIGQKKLNLKIAVLERQYTNLPTLSIITVARNCERLLQKCYKNISEQDYPKDRIEMLLIDGGSIDKTKEMADSYGARVINGGFHENQEARRYVGFLNARNEILVYIDADNFLPNRNWLREMVVPFLEDNEIIATQTLRYGYDKEQTTLNRCFALFGACDPVAFYLGKTDRLPWFTERWDLLGDIVYETDSYYKIRFNPEFFPTIGCNGFLVRKNVFRKLNCRPEDFLHTDVHYDLMKMGLNNYGIVKTTIVHATADTFIKFIKKRMRYMQTHHRQLGTHRRYKVFDSTRREDVLNLIKFVGFACTFFKPFYDSIKGYLKVKDIAWFMHPFVCTGFVFAYGYSTVLHFFTGRTKK